MKTGNGNNNNLRLFRLEQRLVDNAIGKSAHLASPNLSSKRLPRQRKMFDALGSCPDFISEFTAEPGSLRIIVTNRFPEFAPRR
uniref:Uncharacterized protein n=1 Tax=Candidatus Kentrum sp. FW TaxID=2126338 RepID=A0A450TG15_9GAMM|nr:MAG: hypothetical protein BECKFW1821B_GA0114236_111311 [Candidatus Kentron sp. FW]